MRSKLLQENCVCCSRGNLNSNIRRTVISLKKIKEGVPSIVVGGLPPLSSDNIPGPHILLPCLHTWGMPHQTPDVRNNLVSLFWRAKEKRRRRVTLQKIIKFNVIFLPAILYHLLKSLCSPSCKLEFVYVMSSRVQSWHAGLLLFLISEISCLSLCII